MKRTLFTVITFFAVTVARASDLATTFHFNPSLSREANPIVAYFGADATTLLFSNVIGTVVLLFIPLLVYWRLRPKPLNSQPANAWDFASLLLYDRIMRRWQLVRAAVLGWPLPRNWIELIRLWGFAGCWTVVFGSLFATFSWWAISGWHWTAYQRFRSSFAIGNYPLIELAACLPVFCIAVIVFFRTEFADYKAQLGDGDALCSPEAGPRCLS